MISIFLLVSLGMFLRFFFVISVYFPSFKVFASWVIVADPFLRVFSDSGCSVCPWILILDYFTSSSFLMRVWLRVFSILFCLFVFVTMMHWNLIYYIKFGACITSVYLINNLYFIVFPCRGSHHRRRFGVPNVAPEASSCHHPDGAGGAFVFVILFMRGFCSYLEVVSLSNGSGDCVGELSEIVCDLPWRKNMRGFVT